VNSSVLHSHFLLHFDILVIQDQTAGFEMGVMVRERMNKNSKHCRRPIWQPEFVACNTLPLYCLS